MTATAGPTVTSGRTRVHKIRRRLTKYGYEFVWEWQASNETKEWVPFTESSELERQWRTWTEAQLAAVILAE